MKMKCSTKSSGLRKPGYDAGGLVAFRDEQNADGRADSYFELADPARVKALAKGTDRIGDAFSNGKIFSNLGNDFAAREKFIRDKEVLGNPLGDDTPPVRQMNGYKAGGVIGDAPKDKGVDTIDAKVRPGEYMLNPETVADAFGGGDHSMGVRNLNSIVRNTTGKEPGAKLVGGKAGFADSGGVRPGSPLANMAFPDTTPKPVADEKTAPVLPLGQVRPGSVLATQSQGVLPTAPPPKVAPTPSAPKTLPFVTSGQPTSNSAPMPVADSGVRVQPQTQNQAQPQQGSFSPFRYAGKDELGHHVYLGADGKPMTKIFKGGDNHGLIQYDPSGMNVADPREAARAIAFSGNASEDARKAATNVLQSEAVDQHYKAAEEAAKAAAVKSALAAGMRKGGENDLDEAFKEYDPVTDKEGNVRYVENPVKSATNRKNMNLLLRRNGINPSNLTEDEMRTAISIVAPELDIFKNMQTGQSSEGLPVSDLPVSESGGHFMSGLRQKKMGLLDPLSANVDFMDLFGDANTVVDAAGNPVGTTTGKKTSLARQPSGNQSARGVTALRGLPFVD